MGRYIEYSGWAKIGKRTIALENEEFARKATVFLEKFPEEFKKREVIRGRRVDYYTRYRGSNIVITVDANMVQIHGSTMAITKEFQDDFYKSVITDQKYF